MDLGVSASTVSILTSEGWDKEVRGACVYSTALQTSHTRNLFAYCVCHRQYVAKVSLIELTNLYTMNY